MIAINQNSIRININSRFHFKHDSTKELLISLVKSTSLLNYITLVAPKDQRFLQNYRNYKKITSVRLSILFLILHMSIRLIYQKINI